jgi:hypothetical protein
MTSPQAGELHRDSYRGVVLVLLAAAALGSVAAVLGALRLANLPMLAAAVTLGLATGVLIGVWNARSGRA